MGDHQEKPDVVNLGPFVGVNLNLWLTFYVAVIVADADVKWIKPNPNIYITNWVLSICICFFYSYKTLTENVDYIQRYKPRPTIGIIISRAQVGLYYTSDFLDINWVVF